ncbi:hypothetical protein [Marivita geojedonensis]|uniref:hypothetical protein n=1 Tax=Marivita geojedonensis TaxID=1123756 RepID=UPI00117D982C|nr:hypothetical protein [Marivita geojedonensis]
MEHGDGQLANLHPRFNRKSDDRWKQLCLGSWKASEEDMTIQITAQSAREADLQQQGVQK